jgi:putative ABC transport system substrate-binding protein
MILVNRCSALALLMIVSIAPLAPARGENLAVARIGEVWLQDEAAAGPYHDSFAEGLRELGYIEGRNLILLTRYANGDKSQLPSLLKELIGLHVDVLFVSQGAVSAAKSATATTPIVCATMNDPIGTGLVNSLSRPGGNLTGISWQSVDTATKRLELALELRPRPTRLAVFFDGEDRAARLEVDVLKTAARKARVTVAAFDVRNLHDLDAAFSSIRGKPLQTIYVVDTVTTVSMRDEIAAGALRLHIAMVSESRVYAEAGGVLAYGARLTAALKRGALYVHRILKGANPQDLPIEQPTEFDLVVNLKAARAVGTQVPESILSRADHVIR